MQTVIHRLITRLGRRLALPRERPEEVLKKATLLLISLLTSLAGLIWAAMYWALGHTGAALVPLSYSIIVGSLLIGCLLTRRYHAFLELQLLLIFALPFALQYRVGGLLVSGAVMLWGFLAPLGSAMFQGARRSVLWFGLYLATTIAFVVFDPQISLNPIQVTNETIIGFFAMNILGVSTIVFVSCHYFLSQHSVALQEATKAKEAQERFAVMASHEFRTPLSVMQGATDLLLRYHGKLTEEQRSQRLDRIRDQIGDLTEILDDLLAPPNSIRSRQSLASDTVDLKALCARLIDDLRETDGNEHEFVLSCSGEANSLHTIAFHVRRMVVNVLNNAARHTPKNTLIEVDIKVEDAHAYIAIRDEGPGIPPEEHNVIFEAFQTGGVSDGSHGRGLGLAIARRSATALNGTIKLESEPPHGATFRIDFPAMDPDHDNHR